MQLYPVVLQNKHRFVPSAVGEVFIKRRKDDYWRVFTLQFHFDQALPKYKYIYRQYCIAFYEEMLKKGLGWRYLAKDITPMSKFETSYTLDSAQKF